jgi:predicted small metal-binding protein
MKRIHCGDLIPGCAFKAQAATEQEVLHEEADHVRNAHGLEVNWQFIERARSRIREAGGSAAEQSRREAVRHG